MRRFLHSFSAHLALLYCFAPGSLLEKLLKKSIACCTDGSNGVLASLDHLPVMHFCCRQLEVPKFKVAAIEQSVRQVSSRTRLGEENDRQWIHAAPPLLLIKSLSSVATSYQARCTAQGWTIVCPIMVKKREPLTCCSGSIAPRRTRIQANSIHDDVYPNPGGPDLISVDFAETMQR